MSTTHYMVWVPKPKQIEKMRSNTQTTKLHKYRKQNSQVAVGKECSKEYKQVPTQSSMINSEQLRWVPKIVLLTPSSKSTQQEDTSLSTKQPPSVQQKKKWVRKPKRPMTNQNPQQQVKTNKMIWQKK